MGLLSKFNLNGINTHLAMERKADMCGKGEMASKSGFRSARQLRTVTRIAWGSLAPKLTTGALL